MGFYRYGQLVACIDHLQAAVDSLYSLYNRSRFSEDDFKDLVGPMFKDETIGLLKNLYQWLIVDPSDIDEAKYLLLKKFSEVPLISLDIIVQADRTIDDIQCW